MTPRIRLQVQSSFGQALIRRSPKERHVVSKYATKLQRIMVINIFSHLMFNHWRYKSYSAEEFKFGMFCQGTLILLILVNEN